MDLRGLLLRAGEGGEGERMVGKGRERKGSERKGREGRGWERKGRNGEGTHSGLDPVPLIPASITSSHLSVTRLSFLGYGPLHLTLAHSHALKISVIH